MTNPCACGCGLEANPQMGAFLNYHHGTRYERNGRRAVPYHPNDRMDRPCRYCGEVIPRVTAANAYHPECLPPEPEVAPLTGADIRLLARTLAARDPYPLETTSADRSLANPVSEEDAFTLRQRERGLTRVDCPVCGSGAWQEPPCLVNGVETRVVRCRSCAAARKANLRCVVCGERPPRYRRDMCAPCWRERRENEMATTNGTATKAPHATCPYCKQGFDPKRSTQVTCGAEKCKKAHVSFLSSGPERRALGPGAPPVGRWSTKEERDAALEQGAREAVAAGDYDKPASDGIFGSEPEAYEPTPSQGLCDKCGVAVGERVEGLCSTCHLFYGKAEQCDTRNPTACPVLAAVLALEALPPEKINSIMDLVEARREARLAEARAAGLLRELAASL